MSVRFVIWILLLLLPGTLLAGHGYRGDRYYNSGIYMGINVGPFHDSEIDDDFSGAMFKLGFDFDNFFAVELHLGGSTWEDRGYADYEERLSSVTGLFFRTNLPLERHKLYGLLGYSNVDLETSELIDVSPFGELWEDTVYERSGISYGLGLDLFFAPRSALNFQWVEYLSEEEQGRDGGDISQFSIGFRYSFY